MRHSRSVLAVVAIAALAVCAQQEEPPALDQRPNELVPTLARVQELERRAREIARADGCFRRDQCATAPVGAKACGGPRTYLVYCKATTNEQELLRVLDELRRTEEAYNREAGIASDCAFVTPPSLRVQGMSCVAATP